MSIAVASAFGGAAGAVAERQAREEFEGFQRMLMRLAARVRRSRASLSDEQVADLIGRSSFLRFVAEARDKLIAALRKIVASKEYTEFMTQRGFGVIYQGPEDFAKYMAKSDADLGATMKAVGLAK